MVRRKTRLPIQTASRHNPLGAKRGSMMQFHLNGFEPGDPEIFDPAERYPASGAKGPVPAEVDVLIIGCGPAGLTLAAQLSAFPDITCCIVEQKPVRMLLGQADGIACRTMEMFHAFGFSERVLKEACWINETTFWKADEAQLRASSAVAAFRMLKMDCQSFRTSFSTRRAYTISISILCAVPQRSWSRTIHGASRAFSFRRVAPTTQAGA